MKKILGITLLLLAICTITALINPQFLSAYNLQNTLRWTSLFGILSVGAAFVIITGGIDLSTGSLVALTGCVLPMLVVGRGWSPWIAIPAVLLLSVAVGLWHGLLITRLKLQPFVVTLCGLLLYRGIARWITGDQVQGFGMEHDDGLRQLAIGRPCMLTSVMIIGGLLAAVGLWFISRRSRKDWSEPARMWAFRAALLCGVWGIIERYVGVTVLGEIETPTPFLVLLVLSAIAGGLLQFSVFGRHLLAVGRNEQAARYSGVDTQRVLLSAYVICSLLGGIGGVFFALDLNTVQPVVHGNFYELYAIAAAVLGGCSLRGGEGSILGVLVGAAVMRVLYNSINLLEIPTQLEFAIIGGVILLGAITDELVRRAAARKGRSG